eukprot:scaffold8_cov127-Isochrysis_galbana.AAC.2
MERKLSGLRAARNVPTGDAAQRAMEEECVTLAEDELHARMMKARRKCRLISVSLSITHLTPL